MSLWPNVSIDDHIIGGIYAPLTLVEFADYGCSFCAEAEETISSVRSDLGQSLCFVFRHFPIVELHPSALRAALVAESATPDQFWTLHALLFANHNRLDDESLLSYASEAGVPADVAFNALRRGGQGRVQEDMNSGVESGVTGTPTFFVNGQQFQGDWRGAALRDALNESSASSTGTEVSEFPIVNHQRSTPTLVSIDGSIFTASSAYKISARSK